jgi:hypothetical protein
MQEIIYLYGKIYEANRPPIFLLARSTQSREGEREGGEAHRRMKPWRRVASLSPADQGRKGSSKRWPEGWGSGGGWVVEWKERDTGGMRQLP